MFNFDNLAENLPDALAKDKDSNNYKLLEIEKKIYDRIFQMLKDVADSRNIDNCHGKILDDWGKWWKVARGTADDNQYRLRIKAKIGQGFCDGSRDSIANSLGYMLSYDPNSIKITNGSKKNTVAVLDLPYTVIIQAGFSDEEIADIIKSMLPFGVGLELNISGTFELGENWHEQDAEKGLSDMERTVGGELGMVLRR